MKMNKIDASKFPSWLFSRFKKQESFVTEDLSATEDNSLSKGDVFTDASVSAVRDVPSDKAVNKEACQENSEKGVLVKTLNEEKTTESNMMEFGIAYGKKSGALSEFSFGIETMEEIKEKTPDSTESSNTDKNSETNEAPAITDDIVNSGAVINTVDPFKILDQLSSIETNRSKKR